MSTRRTLRDFLSSKGQSESKISLNPKSKRSDNFASEGDDLGFEQFLNEELLGLDDEETGFLGDYLEFIRREK